MEYLIILIGFFILVIICYLLKRLCKNYNIVNNEFLIPLYNRRGDNYIFEDNRTLEENHTLEENRTLDDLPSHIQYVSTSNDECAICLEPFMNKDIIQYDCLHKYHTECINLWNNERKNNILCPECGI